MKKILIVFLAIFFLNTTYVLPANAQWGSLLEKLGISKNTSLSDTKIADGLKEALRVGIDNTVKFVGQTDGYFKNANIKILMPERIRQMDTALRKVGLGPKMDEFMLSMNRAAEKAAPFARDIFIDALMKMNIEDAKKILSGTDTAATDYFKAATSQKLMDTYKPLVAKAMSEYQVTKKYQGVTGAVKNMPMLGQLPGLNIENYVSDKALQGLFYVLGEQEKNIRNNTAARITPLLQEVFGKISKS
jgi:hypothetical protein